MRRPGKSSSLGKHAANTSNIVTGDMTTLCIPPDDGSIEQAFIEIDERLFAWFSVMRRAEGRVRELGSGTAQVLTEDPPVDSVDPITPEPAPTPPAPDHAERQSAVVSDDTSVEVDTTVEPQPPPTPTSTGTEDDAEALLDSLDPALAQVIRVLHRLNPGRSWRELIEEHQSKGKATMTPATGRQSWWRRSR